jgi:hypothetical protein
MDFLTSNVGKYQVGQLINLHEVRGNVVRIEPNEPGASSGPGRIFVSLYPPGTVTVTPDEGISQKQDHSQSEAMSTSMSTSMGGPLDQPEGACLAVESELHQIFQTIIPCPNSQFRRQARDKDI